MGKLALLGTALGLLPLAGCPTVDLGDTPSDIGLCNPAGGVEYFETMIWPDYVKPTDPARGCTKAGQCHNEAGGNPPNFKTMPVDFALNYRQAQGYLNCGQPMMSDMLTKPLAGINAHGGGELIPANDPSIQIFLGWFEE
jgi:hypothetical protein